MRVHMRVRVRVRVRVLSRATVPNTDFLFMRSSFYSLITLIHLQFHPCPSVHRTAPATIEAQVKLVQDWSHYVFQRAFLPVRKFQFKAMRV